MSATNASRNGCEAEAAEVPVAAPEVEADKPARSRSALARNEELARAEKMRREFSANVSHEMKTPLQVISGYAELMANGLVPPEDVPRFAQLIYEVRSLLDSEQSKDSEFRSRYYKEALNYLNRFWKEIFAYLDDGELPIDNNLAERTIRKLTTQRNNSLHYGSDAGAEMAATYHSVIGTVKLHGSSIWNFIGTFFKNIFNGCRDYVNMVPDKITLAASQC